MKEIIIIKIGNQCDSVNSKDKQLLVEMLLQSFKGQICFPVSTVKLRTVRLCDPNMLNFKWFVLM